jgi:hypothetical protein
MNFPRLLVFSILLCLGTPARAQMVRTLYQLFQVDSAQTLRLDISDIYEINTWAGNSVLVETTIKLGNGSPEILDYLIKKGRYDIAMDTVSPTELRLYTKMPDRDKNKLKTPSGEVTEIPEAKIFVPDSFIWTEDRKTLTRKQE